MSVMDNLKLGAYTRYSGSAKAEIQSDVERVMNMFPPVARAQESAFRDVVGRGAADVGDSEGAYV